MLHVSALQWRSAALKGQRGRKKAPLEFPERKPEVVDGYLPSTVAYLRWFWDVFEREVGKYDFSVIDKSIETAKTRGQTLALRIMAFGSTGQPLVPKWYRDKYPMETVDSFGDKGFFPVHDSKEYLEKYGAVIREFGRRYDGHPMIDTVDVGYIGPWGEGAGEMSAEQMNRFNQVHKEGVPDVRRGWSKFCRRAGQDRHLQYAAGCNAGTRYGDVSDGGSTGSAQDVLVEPYVRLLPRYADQELARLRQLEKISRALRNRLGSDGLVAIRDTTSISSCNRA